MKLLGLKLVDNDDAMCEDTNEVIEKVFKLTAITDDRLSFSLHVNKKAYGSYPLMSEYRILNTFYYLFNSLWKNL